MFGTHPWVVGFSDCATTDLLSDSEVAALLTPTSLGVSSASLFTAGVSWGAAAVLPVVPTLGRILNLERRNIMTCKHTKVNNA